MSGLPERARVGLLIKPLAFFCVGSGMPSLEADITFYTMPIMAPDGPVEIKVIPGSTVKGVLRSSASRICHLLGLRSCKELRPEFISKAHEEGVCDVCALFGYPGSNSPSPLETTDFYLVPREEKAIEIFEKGLMSSLVASSAGREAFRTLTRIRLWDKSLTVAPGGLFTLEVLNPMWLFYGEIRLYRGLLEARGARLSWENACKLLMAAIAEMRFYCLGKKTMVDAKIVGQEGLYVEGPVASILYDGLRRWAHESI